MVYFLIHQAQLRKRPPRHIFGPSLANKVNIVGQLMAIVPCIQHLIFGIVVHLGHKGVLICEWQTWSGLRVRVRIVGVQNLALFLVVDVNGVQHATHDEAVSVRVAFQPSPPCRLLLHGEVAWVQLADDDDFVLRVVVIQRWVDHPEATLVYGEIDV